MTWPLNQETCADFKFILYLVLNWSLIYQNYLTIFRKTKNYPFTTLILRVKKNYIYPECLNVMPRSPLCQDKSAGLLPKDTSEYLQDNLKQTNKQFLTAWEQEQDE